MSSLALALPRAGPGWAGRELARRALSRARSGWGAAVAIAVAVVASALVLLPVLSLVRVGTSGGLGVLTQLSSTVLPDALLQTALLLLGVAVGAGSLGAGTAWLVTAYRFPGSKALAWLLPLPLAVPTYVAAFIYVELLDSAGPVQAALRDAFGFRSRADYWFPDIRSMLGCITVLSLVLYPYVYVPGRTAFLSRGHAAVDAARTLGGSGWQIAWRVGLPLARPALAAGVALALLEALNDIGATEFLGVRTLTLSAYTAWLNRGDLPGAAQIACIALLGISLLLALAWSIRPARPGGTADVRAAEPVRLRGLKAAAATLACAVPVALGLVVPVLFLASDLLGRDSLALEPAFLRHLAVTVGLAGLAALLILAVALPIAVATRWTSPSEGAALSWLSGLGYALPGTFLVLGLLQPLVALDNLIASALGSFASGGLLLTGSVGGLLVAYLIRFLRVATAPMTAQLQSAGDRLDSVARVLGAGPTTVIRFVQLPVIRPALAAAALLVFVDCLKELPATLLLRPLNVETLATLVYGAAARGSFEDGAPAALLIVAISLGPVAWLTRAARPASTRLAALAGPQAAR